MKHFFIILVSFFTIVAYGALNQNILVHTSHGLIPINQLSLSHRIISGEQMALILAVQAKKVLHHYTIVCEHETIQATEDQLFFDANTKQWIPAFALTSANVLIDIYHNPVACLSIKKVSYCDTMYDLFLSEPHTFFVGKTGILTHNAVFAALPAISLTSMATIGTWAVAAFGALKFAYDARQQQMGSNESVGLAASGGPPEDNDKNKNGKYYFSKLKLEQSINHIIKNSNKMHHIFGKKVHNLDLLVQKLGNEKEVIKAIINELNGNISYNCVLNDTIVTIDRYNIHVRGKVIDGVLKIGTIFIP